MTLRKSLAIFGGLASLTFSGLAGNIPQHVYSLLPKSMPEKVEQQETPVKAPEPVQAPAPQETTERYEIRAMTINENNNISGILRDANGGIHMRAASYGSKVRAQECLPNHVTPEYLILKDAKNEIVSETLRLPSNTVYRFLGNGIFEMYFPCSTNKETSEVLSEISSKDELEIIGAELEVKAGAEAER